jgi:translation initiation factor 1
MSKNSKLVWSNDPRDRARIASDAGKIKIKEDSSEHVSSLKWVAVFRIEKGGRGGKTVTVIDQLPKQDKFLQDLCKELKSKCGSGGTYTLTNDAGIIEIQGDKRDAIKAIFEKKGIKYKGM